MDAAGEESRKILEFRAENVQLLALPPRWGESDGIIKAVLTSDVRAGDRRSVAGECQAMVPERRTTRHRLNIEMVKLQRAHGGYLGTQRR